MAKIHALTAPHNGIVNKIETPIEIIDYFTGKKIATKGLWDTGATHSAITASLAKELGLVKVETITVSGVHGKQSVPAYYVKMVLNKGNVSFEAVVSECSELSEDKSVGVLIGMNVINEGDFAITNFQGNTTMSFRIPSIQKIDFVSGMKTGQQIVKDKIPTRNDPCHCGSGKKYKNCCGKNK